MRLLLPLLAGLLTLLGNAAPKLSAQSDLFVSRAETRLVLADRPFRFGGANIEWLGLEGYGPADPRGPRLPSHYEIDDAMATARELGARVVRSQTMGDSVGCNECLEPALGQFNQAAFERVKREIGDLVRLFDERGIRRREGSGAAERGSMSQQSARSVACRGS